MSKQELQLTDAVSEQDRLLGELHNSVLNTRQYALAIGEDLEEQNTMLDDLQTDVERATDESRRQNYNVGQLLWESESRGFWTLFIVLSLILVVLLIL
ncbi:SNARE domain containing protein, putative [Trypanosoma equiperdum]|uniref:t-SNARE coiled-coil homology domain-containing protein n=2 Tax=Trypanozoon TaxID=39700 RepID=Q38C10_TRYB2|nr:hypothetical protein, conserved [Trypanosoma brucei brucei TREU927]EAN77660.1 hypothetical protein, conserved [Trypanosoma brucei brucei TREU927]SCU66710.1 SNARE domain containing protein, putative [Trypanosoma equiperdum]